LPEVATAFAPGRVNLIGEHTDYNDGLALPFAISAGVTVSARAADAAHIEAHALDFGESDRFEIDEPQSRPGWRAFVRGSVAELRRAGLPLVGATLQIAGDLPRGAGLSSSAALEVALCLALIGLTDAPLPDRLQLARICSRVENEWVGARTGLLDQLAALYGQREHAIRIDFRSLEIMPTPLELNGFKLVTLDSGERHAHAASGYNARRAECGEARERLGLQSLREATIAMIDRLPPPLSDRVRHVIGENARVDEAVDALARRDLARLGQLLDASHSSLRDCYEVSTRAVEATVMRLRRAGAIGARVVGGGFGGHVLGLLPPEVQPPEGAIEVRPGAGARVQ
jgi:galactokinase